MHSTFAPDFPFSSGAFDRASKGCPLDQHSAFLFSLLGCMTPTICSPSAFIPLCMFLALDCSCRDWGFGLDVLAMSCACMAAAAAVTTGDIYLIILFLCFCPAGVDMLGMAVELIPWCCGHSRWSQIMPAYPAEPSYLKYMSGWSSLSVHRRHHIVPLSCRMASFNLSVLGKRPRGER